ncbi:hypothetical protein CAOG_010064 [Capsaspora owczarzaki ATCC 30864]|uniref:BolA family protein n=1 Tax=Capsaspora owczarzaki (strain ATCC 30864) TaxID=595528 RepID=A0A0D2WWJ9_CAPO3|nr:hypothetical protein CAOG_010064 [Capsaspora owczarzaki ATCC 30864]
MADALQSKLVAALQATHVEVVDVSGGCGAKFEAVIVSPQFEGKKLLQRHRQVLSSVLEANICTGSRSISCIFDAEMNEENSC